MTTSLERLVRASVPGAWGPWRRLAECAKREHAEVDFFPVQGRGYEAAVGEAKRVCGACPVRDDCLDAHLGERYGVFGGLDEDERRRLARRRRSESA